ncbi:hypothetical protein ACFLZB_00115 [Nanoarchaeota archaeon]
MVDSDLSREVDKECKRVDGILEEADWKIFCTELCIKNEAFELEEYVSEVVEENGLEASVSTIMKRLKRERNRDPNNGPMAKLVNYFGRKFKKDIFFVKIDDMPSLNKYILYNYGNREDFFTLEEVTGNLFEESGIEDVNPAYFINFVLKHIGEDEELQGAISYCGHRKKGKRKRAVYMVHEQDVPDFSDCLLKYFEKMINEKPEASYRLKKKRLKKKTPAEPSPSPELMVLEDVGENRWQRYFGFVMGWLEPYSQDDSSVTIYIKKETETETWEDDDYNYGDDKYIQLEFDFFKKKPLPVKPKESIEDDYKDDEDDYMDNEEAFLDRYMCLLSRVKKAGPLEIFPIEDALTIYVGEATAYGRGRRTTTLRTLLASSDDFRKLAILEKEHKYETSEWQIKKGNIPKLYKTILGWRGDGPCGPWGAPSEGAKELMKE